MPRKPGTCRCGTTGGRGSSGTHCIPAGCSALGLKAAQATPEPFLWGGVCFHGPQARWESRWPETGGEEQPVCWVRRAGPRPRAMCLQVKAHTPVIPSLSPYLQPFLPYQPFPQPIKTLKFPASEKENPIVKILHPFSSNWPISCLPLSAQKLGGVVCNHKLGGHQIPLSTETALLGRGRHTHMKAQGSPPTSPGTQKRRRALSFSRYLRNLKGSKEMGHSVEERF